MLIKKFYIVLVISILSACGYSLKGVIDLPADIKTICLEGASYELLESFKKSFGNSSRVKFTETPENADLLIKIYNEKSDRRILSLNASGAANDFELDYDFNFDVLDLKRKVLATNQMVSIKREYFNNQQAIIAKDNEENVIKSEMYRQAVGTLLNGVKVALDNNK